MPSRSSRAAWPAAYGATALGLAALAAHTFEAYLQRSDLDHGIHVRLAQQLVAQGVLLPHFAYHLLVAVLAGGSSDPARLATAACATLVLLVLAKLALSLGLARDLTSRAGEPIGAAFGLVLAVSFFFVAPLPKWWRTENIYLGQLSPTVWHNPTAIAGLPLAVATFWAFVRRSAATRRDDLAVGVLLALSVTAKPNFALAFVPAALLLRLWRGPALERLILALAPTLAVLGWQYLHAWSSPIVAPGAGMVTLAPGEVWGSYSPHPAVSVLVSLAFPLAVAAFALPDARHGRPLAAAWLITLMAVAQFALLAEPEPRTGDANYYWAVVPAMYLLFLVSACELLAARRLSAARGWGRRVCWALFALHVASGVYFYLHPFQLAVVD